MYMTEEQYREYLKRRGIKIADEKSKKKPKYNNKHTWVDGVCFDSKKEADYYGTLKLLQKAGAIKGFCRQCEFILSEGNESTNAIKYIADFIVFKSDGTFDIVDTKGIETDVFKLKHKMFKTKYPELKLKIVKE